MSDTPDSAVRDAVASRCTAFLDELRDWLRIPSVSADPARAEDVQRSAAWPADALRRTGFPTVEIWPAPGHPADRRVAVPGFYDGVVPLTGEECRLFAELPLDEERRLRTAHSHATRGEAGHTTLERVRARPTAEVNGISIPSDGRHAPDEKVEPDLLPKTAEAAAFPWEELARSRPADLAAGRPAGP